MGAALMDPETKVSEETIKLMSVYAAHRIGLESPVEIIHPQHGKYREPGTGKEIVFNAGRATIPASWWPLLENHPQRLVQRGLVNREDEFRSINAAPQGPRIVEGAVAASTSRRTRVAPHQGWDEATTKQIGDWIGAGLIHDLEGALSYELGKRRRKMVVRALTDALLGDTPPASDPEPPPAAAVPDGIGGGDL